MRVRLRSAAPRDATLVDALATLHDALVAGDAVLRSPRRIDVRYDALDLVVRITGRGFREAGNRVEGEIRRYEIRDADGGNGGGNGGGSVFAVFDRLSHDVGVVDRLISRVERGRDPDGFWTFLASDGLQYVSTSDRPDGRPSNSPGGFFLREAGTGVPYAFDGDDDLTFTRRSDQFEAAGGDDRIRGLGGADFLEGEGGEDRIEGGAGSDALFGGGGDDAVFGGAGGDQIGGGAGDDLGRGGGGRDFMRGGAGDDDLRGDAGADDIGGETGRDALRGGKGGDSLNGGAGRDRLWGGAGDDVFEGGAGADRMFGGAGDDRFDGDFDSSLDDVYPGAFDDFIFGGAGDDVVLIVAGFDVVRGGAGRDEVTVGISPVFLPSDILDTAPPVGTRFEDFDPTQDDIYINQANLDDLRALRETEPGNPNWWQAVFTALPNDAGAVFSSDGVTVEILDIEATRANFDALFTYDPV